MSAAANTMILLHERAAPPIAVAAAGRTEALRVPGADAAATLPGMAKDALADLQQRGLQGACVLVGLGDRPGVFAQALALEMLGRDLPVHCVATVPDDALPD